MNSKECLNKTLITLLSLLTISCSQNFNKLKGEKSVTYFDNGNIKSIGYEKNGLHTGKYVEYYQNGNIKFEAFYKDGLQDSIQKTYTEDGIIYQIGFFKKGLLDGISETYYNNGSVHIKANHFIENDSTYVSEYYTFDKSGEIIRDSSLFFTLSLTEDTIKIGDTIQLKITLEHPNEVKPNMMLIIEKINSNLILNDTLKDIDDKIRDLSITYKTDIFIFGKNTIYGQIWDYYLFHNNDTSEISSFTHKMYFQKTFFVE